MRTIAHLDVLPCHLVSYAQRYEDLYLHALLRRAPRRLLHRHRLGPPGLRQHLVRASISGAGAASRSSPIRGWRSLTRAVRPRDRHIEALVGAAAGAGDLLSGGRFPRLLDHDREPCPARRRRNSARLAGHDRAGDDAARSCARQHAPAAFDFLKVDVEGAEPDVLLGGDWQSFRPKVVVVEALAPYTLAPAWEAWEPFLARHGYRLRLVRQPQPLLPRRGGKRACAPFRDRAAAVVRRRLPVPQRQAGARATTAHPDHRLATARRQAPR